ncbi:MAG: SH3 domain-containing protein [Chloroflexota bacterium]
MLNLLKLLLIVAMLGIPLLVVTALPRLFELAGSVPGVSSQQADATATPGFRLSEPTPTNVRTRFGNLDQTPPPTLAAAVAVSPVSSPQPTATGERISIGNTGGRGAILRADPVSGRPLATLHEQQVLDVLERQTVPGGGVWVRVRTSDGVEGWVTGLVALPVTASTR